MKSVMALTRYLEAEENRRAMLVRVFESDDELANVAVFRWLLSNHLSSVPIEVRALYGIVSIRIIALFLFSIAAGSSSHSCVMRLPREEELSFWNFHGNSTRRMGTTTLPPRLYSRSLRNLRAEGKFRNVTCICEV